MWSELVKNNHPIVDVSKLLHSLDDRRTYHNWSHINRNYENAARLYIPYDINLDVANLFHDVVYDEFPDKEKRSYELFELVYSTLSTKDKIDIDKSRVKYLIETTKTHSIIDVFDQNMIKIDLFDFTNQNQVRMNWNYIIEENIRLYKISKEAACKASNAFMFKFQNTILENIKYTNYQRDTEFYSSLFDGINLVIKLNREAIDGVEY